MSTISEPRMKTFLSKGVIRPFRYVKWGTNEGEILESDLNEKSVGVYQGSTTLASGEFADVALPGGGALLQVSETVTKGKLLTSTADGEGEVVDAAGEFYGAAAYQAGAANDVIYVELLPTTEAVSSDA